MTATFGTKVVSANLTLWCVLVYILYCTFEHGTRTVTVRFVLVNDTCIYNVQSTVTKEWLYAQGR